MEVISFLGLFVGVEDMFVLAHTPQRQWVLQWHFGWMLEPERGGGNVLLAV